MRLPAGAGDAAPGWLSWPDRRPAGCRGSEKPAAAARRRPPGGTRSRRPRWRQGGAVHDRAPHRRPRPADRARAPDASAADRGRRRHGHDVPAAVLPRDGLAARHARDGSLRRYVEINYGPWDRLDGDRPFVPGVGPRPPGAELYPHDITKEEFERAAAGAPARAARSGAYTVVRRDRPGRLTAVPYHEAYARPMRDAARKLREAAGLADDPGLRRYLELRADALETDDYQPSDLAWLDMKTNTLDIVIGPIETYIDQLFGYKAAAESYVLLKDKEWSGRLARYAACCRRCSAGCRCPRRTSGSGRAPTRTSTPTTRCTMPATPTPAPRPSPSTCRTTRRCSSGRAPGGCSSRT